MNFVTARGWEDLSDLLKTYESLEINADIPQISQYVRDPSTAADFAAFYDMYKRYDDAYMLEDIFEGRAEKDVKQRFKSAGLDEKIGVIGLITARLNTESQLTGSTKKASAAVPRTTSVLRGSGR